MGSRSLRPQPDGPDGVELRLAWCQGARAPTGGARAPFGVCSQAPSQMGVVARVPGQDGASAGRASPRRTGQGLSQLGGGTESLPAHRVGQKIPWSRPPDAETDARVVGLEIRRARCLPDGATEAGEAWGAPTAGHGARMARIRTSRATLHKSGLPEARSPDSR